MTQRMARLFVILSAAVALSACSGESVSREREAQLLAKAFNDAAGLGNVEAMLELVDYPFNYDGRRIVRSEEELRAILAKDRGKIRARVAPANYMEIASYAELLDGKEIEGVSLTEEQAREQAERIGLREGGILVRCYHSDPKRGRRDARGYWLVMHDNDLGDLKITTYYD